MAHIRRTFLTSYIERYHAYRVARNKKLIAFFVIKREGEDTAQFLYKIHSILAIQCKDNLAVTSGLELILSGKIGTYVAMIVDFTIHSQNLFSVRREQWLSPTLRIDSGDCCFILKIHAIPHISF